MGRTGIRATASRTRSRSWCGLELATVDAVRARKLSTASLALAVHDSVTVSAGWNPATTLARLAVASIPDGVGLIVVLNPHNVAFLTAARNE